MLAQVSVDYSAFSSLLNEELLNDTDLTLAMT